MPTLSLWRDEIGASCYRTCAAGSADLLAMLGSSWDWQTRLAERGTPLDGSVVLFLSGPSSWVGGSTAGFVEWTGATDIAASLGLGPRSTLQVDDPTDTAALRELRDMASGGAPAPVALRQGDVFYTAYVVDVVPHTDEHRQLRPPFPIPVGLPW